MRIKIANAAYNDLNEIDDYIRSNNPLAANRMESRLNEAISYLSMHPAIGRAGRVTGTRELIVSGTPFIVVYEVQKQIVFVARILHSARKWPNNKNNH